MSLVKGENGIYRGLFRKKGMQPLHLSLRTKSKREGQQRHDAVQQAVRSASPRFVGQLRAGEITVERVTAMVAAGEALSALSAHTSTSSVMPWRSVDAECARYVEALPARGRRPASINNSIFQLQRFRAFEYEGQRIGDLPLGDVTSAMVQAYQRSLVDAETPPNTITVYMARLGALWRWVAAQEQREAREQRREPRPLYSPVDAEQLLREVHRRDRVLTKEEAERLWAATPEPMQWVVGCGLLAGLRIGEALHLRPGLDVDLELGTISVRDQADWKPKTKRSKRLVPMAPALHAVAVRHAERWASASWMMPSPVYQDRPFSELGFRQQFVPVVKRAGLVYGRAFGHGVVFHTLRHTFASHAVMRGVDLYTVAKLLGDSLKMVEDVYADLSPDFKRSAIEKLAGAFDFSSEAAAVQRRDSGEEAAESVQAALQESSFAAN